MIASWDAGRRRARDAADADLGRHAGGKPAEGRAATRSACPRSSADGVRAVRAPGAEAPDPAASSSSSPRVPDPRPARLRRVRRPLRRRPRPPGPGHLRRLRHAARGGARRQGQVQAVPRRRRQLPGDRRRSAPASTTPTCTCATPALVNVGDRVRTGQLIGYVGQHRRRQRLPPALRDVERARLVRRRPSRSTRCPRCWPGTRRPERSIPSGSSLTIGPVVGPPTRDRSGRGHALRRPWSRRAPLRRCPSVAFAARRDRPRQAPAAATGAFDGARAAGRRPPRSPRRPRRAARLHRVGRVQRADERRRRCASRPTAGSSSPRRAAGSRSSTTSPTRRRRSSPTSRSSVHDYWDRGLLGLALDPNFPADGRTSTSSTPTTRTPNSAHGPALGRRLPDAAGRHRRRLRGQRPAVAPRRRAASRRC